MPARVCLVLAACCLTACAEQTYGPPGAPSPIAPAADLAQAPASIFDEDFEGASALGSGIRARHSWMIDGDCQNLRWAPVASCGASGCVRIEGTTDAGCRLYTTVRLPQVPSGERLVLALSHQYRFGGASSGTMRVSLPGEFGPVHALTRRFSLGSGADGEWRPYLADLSDLAEGDYEVGFTLNSSGATFSWSVDRLLLQREQR